MIQSKHVFLVSRALINKYIGWLAVGFKADCLKGDLGLWVGCPPLTSLEGILARIYASFGENHGKLRTARSTSATGV